MACWRPPAPPRRLDARGDRDGELGVPLWGYGLLFWVPVARSTIRLGDLS
jgi:hypothetical protein